jgi:hypothetical protein
VIEARVKVIALSSGEYFPGSSQRKMKTGTRMRRRRVRTVGRVNSFSGSGALLRASHALCL